MTQQIESRIDDSPLIIRRSEGRDAMLGVREPLHAAEFFPAPLAGMDPEYLAAGFEGDDPGVVIAYRGDRPVAYASYVVRRLAWRPRLGPVILGGLPCRQLRLFAYAATPDAPAAVVGEMFGVLLQRRAWDVLHISELPVHNPMAEYLLRLPSGRRRSVVARTFDTYQVRICNTFDTYLKENFTKKTRYNLNREVRLFEQAVEGRAAFRVYASPDDAGEFLDTAVRVAHRSKRARLLPPIGPAAKLAHLAGRGRFRGFILFVGDTPVAFCEATLRWGEPYVEVVAHDQRFSQLSPGKVLLYRMLQDLHASRIVEHLNLGRATPEYRRVFATSSRRVLDVDLYASRPYAQMLRGVAGLADTANHLGRAVVRPCLSHVRRAIGAAARLGLRRLRQGSASIETEPPGRKREREASA
jgi:hypothetical protein